GREDAPSDGQRPSDVPQAAAILRIQQEGAGLHGPGFRYMSPSAGEGLVPIRRSPNRALGLASHVPGWEACGVSLTYHVTQVLHRRDREKSETGRAVAATQRRRAATTDAKAHPPAPARESVRRPRRGESWASRRAPKICIRQDGERETVHPGRGRRTCVGRRPGATRR